MDVFHALDDQYFLYIGIFVGLILLIEGVRKSVSDDGDTRQLNKRMSLMAKGVSTEDILAKYRKQRSGFWSRIPYFGNIPARMRQAGMTLEPRLFLLSCGLLAAGTFLSLQFTMGPLVGAVVAGLVSIVAPMGVINLARKKRIDRFGRQLPDALELMKRGLTVGHPLNVTISNVARNMPDPIGTEFGLMADQVAYGQNLPDAMMDLAERIDQEDFYYLAVSVDIQHGTGGNLAEMLGTLASVIRRRFAMRRRIHAISSEGRISAIILTALPVIMYVGTSFMAPNYYSSVSDDPMYLPIMAAIVTLVVLNGIWLRKLVTFKI